MSKTDNLKQDPVIHGQDYCVFSFVNPKDQVLGKLLYYVNNFMVDEINKTQVSQATQMARKLQVTMRNKINGVLDKLKHSVNETDKMISEILEKNFRDMCVDEDEYVEECRRKFLLNEEELTDKYKMYLVNSRTKLDVEYDRANDHRTSVRGIKFRGAYARYEDARERAKYLRDNVEQSIHTFVIPVGTWVPLDMEADEVQDQDYMLPELNELMGKYHEGVHARNQFYTDRKREMEEAAHASVKENTKERLRRKLREKRNKKMKDDIANMQKLTGNEESS